MTDVGDARDNLAEIVNLCAYLLDHAIHAARDGHLEAAHEYPTDAMVMLGPTNPDDDIWARRITIRIRTAERIRLDSGPKTGWLTDDHDSDNPTPTQVLSYWDDTWRTLNRHLPAVTPTIAAYANYLNLHMTRMANEPRAMFGEFASDMTRLRTCLEQILYAGERDEKGAPCLHCKAMLIRCTDPPKPAPPRYCHGHNGTCRWPDRNNCCLTDRGGLRDTWQCPRCNRSYGYAEYWNAVAASYRANAPALTADDLHTEYGIPTGSIRGWASLGKIRKRGRDLAGRVLYDVADTRRAANQEVA